jgi:hypothetical protein
MELRSSDFYLSHHFGSLPVNCYKKGKQHLDMEKNWMLTEKARACYIAERIHHHQSSPIRNI